MRGSLLAVVGMLLSATSGIAQTPSPQASSSVYEPSFTFDIASVRESPVADSYRVSFQNPSHNSQLDLANVSAENLLSIGYGVDRAQITGVPDVFRGAYFNVRAKSDASTDERLANLDDRTARLEKQHMLQVLLADRFALKVHWESKEGLIYNLVVAKSGLKMKSAGSMAPTAEEQKNFSDGHIPVIYQKGDGGKGYEFIAHGCPMSSLVQMLTGQMGSPVIDKTGLTERYDFVLQYKGALSGTTQDDPNAWPALDYAVPDQLGLKLQAGKGEKKFLVVDHFERPSAN